MSERGTALPGALAAIAVAAALGVGLTDVVRTELALARERVTAATALAAADGCATRALAGLPAGWQLAPPAGPDGIPGTADDGRLAAGPDCTATAAATDGGLRLVVDVEARVPRGRRALAALVGRAAAPGAPAVVWLDGGPGGSAVTGTAVLDGRGSGRVWAALAAPVEPEALDGWLAAAPGVDGGRAAPPRFAVPPPLAALAARAAAAAPGGTAPLVAPPAVPVPAVSFAATDLTLDGARAGAGVLVVDGVLEVRGSLSFVGLVAATRGVAVRAGATCTIAGALWLGGDPPLAVTGALTVRRDDAAIAGGDDLLPLPRLPRLLAIRDVS